MTFLCFSFPVVKAQGIFTDALSAADSADQSARTASLNGYARGAAYFGGDDYDYASLFGEFALQGRISGQTAFLYGDVRIRDGLFFGDRESHFELKEAYAGIRWNRADLFLGTQIVRWARTDGFNPVDNINPVDYFFLSPDPDDQLTGNFMLRTSVRPFRNTEVEIIAIPFYKPSVYKYDLFDMGEGVSFSEGVLPETGFINGTVAARVNVELSSAGFAFSYFRGYDPFYGFKLNDVAFLPDIDIEYRPEMYRKDALGFDMSLVADPWIMRIESSYNVTDDYHAQMHIPNPELYYVGALERSIGRVNTIFQYIGKYIIDFEQLKEPVLYDPDDPLDLYRYAFETVTYESTLYNRRIFRQQEKMNHAVFVSLSASFLYEELRTGFSASYNITSDEYFIRPEVKWNARDGMQISAGAHIMKGPDDSIYDMAGKVLGGFFTGIRMAF
ncbi:MAG: hypothetical protein R6U58_04980 [Bacteroidales bacterium]